MFTVTPLVVVTVVVITICVSPSISLSLANTLPVTSAPGVVLYASSLALVVLGVLASCTVTVTVAVSQSCGLASSQMVYVKVSSPVKPGSGV